MSGRELFDLINGTDLFPPNYQRRRISVYDEKIEMEFDNLVQCLDNAADGVEAVFTAAVILVKLDLGMPIGTRASNLMNKAFNVISANSDRLLPIVFPSLDLIASREITTASEEDFFKVWTKFVIFLKGANSSPSSYLAASVQFAKTIWPKINEISSNPNCPLICEVLELILLGKEMKIEDVSTINIILRIVLDFVNERNDFTMNRREFVSNNEEDWQMIDLISKICPQDQSISEQLETVKKMLPARVKHHEKIQLIDIDPGKIKITVQSDFTKVTTSYKISVSYGFYEGDKQIAVKIYEIVEGTNDEERRRLDKKFDTEAKCYEDCSKMAGPHNCFIGYYGTYKVGKQVHFVMQKGGSTLKTVIEGRTGQKFSENNLTKAFCDLLNSFSEMEAKGIYHRDINPHNILVETSFMELKIIDFSVAARKTDDGNYPIQGTQGYRAPELEQLLRENIRNDTTDFGKADVFSLGLVFLKMIDFGEFNGNTDDLNKYPIERVNGVEYSWAKELLLMMLKKDPNERWSFKDCKELVQRVYTKSFTGSQIPGNN